VGQPRSEASDRAVVVGLDGRQHDGDALALARTLQAALDGELVIAHVIPPPPLGRGMTEYASLARREGRELLSRAAKGSNGATRTRLLETWPAAAALSQLAKDHRAGMLVVGSSHRGSVGRIVPGSTASHLLARGPCAIAVAPVGYAGRRSPSISSIGAAYDGTTESNAALTAAAAAAVRLSASLRLYHVMHKVSDDPSWDQFRRCMQEFAQRILDAGVRQLPHGLEVTTSVLEGHVADVVAAAAARDRVGLLYVGSRGYGPLREALFGGVAGGLLHTARCPLVIVPGTVSVDHAEPRE
jgi:nucleotide-binding universal stress UspA family protein